MDNFYTMQWIKENLTEMKIPWHVNETAPIPQILIEMGEEYHCIDISIVDDGIGRHCARVEGFDPLTQEISPFLADKEEILGWVISKYNAWKMTSES